MHGPSPLARHYSRFKVGERLLLTGHSHQAWPDVAWDGQMQAIEDAALLVDDKWEHAFHAAAAVKQGFAQILGDTDGLYSLAPSTHDLIIKFLSALDYKKRRKIVTTTGEFHSLRRQLKRLGEEGVQIVAVPFRPVSTLADRLIAAVDDTTAAVMTSAVFFETAEIARNLGDVLIKCQKTECPLLIDAYHALNVVPFSLTTEKLQGAYIVGGGYKYCQLGEGNCFLRFPKDSALRPIFTGWFADFASLESGDNSGKTKYGDGGQRFAGSTYDPTSHYRARSVFDFFKTQKLTPDFLRQVSQHQIGLLRDGFDALNLDPKLISRDRSIALKDVGGFLALTSPRAGEVSAALKTRGVLTDSRGTALRFGPAPYLSDLQLKDAMAILGEVLLP